MAKSVKRDVQKVIAARKKLALEKEIGTGTIAEANRANGRRVASNRAARKRARFVKDLGAETPAPKIDESSAPTPLERAVNRQFIANFDCEWTGADSGRSTVNRGFRIGRHVIGWTQNGGVKVAIEYHISDGWMLHVGNATLKMPSVQHAFAAAISWVSGHPQIAGMDIRNDPNLARYYPKH